MGREERASFEGAVFHITVRGNNKADIFLDKRDRNKFLNILKDRKDKYNFKLYCYVCMKNHFHLLMEIGNKASISKIMQAINTSYALYFNKKYGRIGHLLQGRFYSKLVEKDSYLLELSRYIHLNPVRADIVKDIHDYKWSSYQEYCNPKGSCLVDRDFLLSTISPNGNIKEQIAAYRDFVASKSVSDTQA